MTPCPSCRHLIPDRPLTFLGARMVREAHAPDCPHRPCLNCGALRAEHRAFAPGVMACPDAEPVADPGPFDCLDCGACCCYPPSSIPFPAVDGVCCKLAGDPGLLVECTDYANRPERCRALEAGSPGCLRMRAWLRGVCRSAG